MEKKIKPLAFVRARLLVLSALILGLASGCATVPIPPYKGVALTADPADRLEAYYKYRVKPLGWGNYKVGGNIYQASSLPDYYRLSGDERALRWARRGQWWSASSWCLLILSESYFIRESRDPNNQLGSATWAVMLAPLALATWGLQYLGGAEFTDPSAEHFNLYLRRDLGLDPGTQLPLEGIILPAPPRTP